MHAVDSNCSVSCDLGAVCRIGNCPLIFTCNQLCLSGSRHLHQLQQCQRSSQAAAWVEAAFSFHCKNVCCTIASWHNHSTGCVACLVCVSFCILGMLLYGGCPLAGLSTLLFQPWRLCVSARLMLSQQPTGCAVAVRYLPSLSTALIFLCTMFGLNSAPDQTQPIDSRRSLSAQGQTVFSTSLPLSRNPWLCLYIQASHSPQLGIFCEICTSCIRLLWPQTFAPHKSLQTALKWKCP